MNHACRVGQAGRTVAEPRDSGANPGANGGAFGGANAGAFAGVIGGVLRQAIFNRPRH